ncbi:mitochondrial aldehyde dehydrogenase [Purpureocillium takamizusanense]|nr:mitochondrial aldehyde dehydrogenase [Purpureocillium takamizusanense]UNI20458.1 mitochondrial aldehyde dehydrogenase [Purpureocillium takamizusanense]
MPLQRVARLQRRIVIARALPGRTVASRAAIATWSSSPPIEASPGGAAAPAQLTSDGSRRAESLLPSRPAGSISNQRPSATSTQFPASPRRQPRRQLTTIPDNTGFYYSLRRLLKFPSSSTSPTRPRRLPFATMATRSASEPVDLQAPNGVRYTQPTGIFINNEFVKATSGQTITSIDPATEKDIATVQAAGAEDVDAAVQAAHKALRDPSWKQLAPSDRGHLMNKLADAIEVNKETLATIDAWDNGKPYAEALGGDLEESITTFRYYAGWADKVFGQTISTTHQKFAYTLRQPIGVVGQIIPWNYPLSMAAWKLGPALACGNTIVIKAAEQTPLSILFLASLIKEVGFPPGVVNIINGYGKEAGSALVEHPKVDKIAFTGSTATARSIMKMASATLKNITLETGGKSPLLVFDDCDLEQAVKWSHMGIMSNQGQICTATSRILVQDSIYDKFVEQFTQTTKTVSRVGDQWSPETYQGPQVSKAQYQRVLDYIEVGKSEGAKLVSGGKPFDINSKGFFVEPTIFTEVKSEMRIFQEEIFGPVVVISRFSDEAEAVGRANDSTYGLGAAVFTTNLERAHRVAAEIEAGMVWINSTQDSDPRVPFGGVKQSGVGRELGEAGLEAYSQIKAVHVNMGNRI